MDGKAPVSPEKVISDVVPAAEQRTELSMDTVTGDPAEYTAEACREFGRFIRPSAKFVLVAEYASFRLFSLCLRTTLPEQVSAHSQ
jgi:hypothetical protein